MHNIKPHFDINEFFCHCTDKERTNAYKDSKVISNLFSLGLLMQSIREMVDCPIIVTSGYRDRFHNESVGGVGESQHMKGQACDFVLLDKSLNLKNVADNICVLCDYDQLIVYETFFHISYNKVYNRRQIIFK